MGRNSKDIGLGFDRFASGKLGLQKDCRLIASKAISTAIFEWCKVLIFDLLHLLGCCNMKLSFRLGKIE